MFGGYGRAAAALAYPLAGFLTVVLVWSVFMGDFGARTTSILPPIQDLVDDGSHAHPVWSGWSKITDIFVFGDSYSATYFNPEGNQPSDDAPFGNTDLIGGFDSGEGPKWIQYLKVMYKPDSPLRIYNFAKFGAIVERHAYDPRIQGIGASPECVSLKEQVRCWIKFYCPPSWKNIKWVWKPETTLFTMWFGVNDIIQAIEKNVPIAADPIFASYSSSFERMYKEGARNFLMFNVPMIDRSLGDPTGKIKLDIWTYNQRLQELRHKWTSRHKDVTIFLFDTHTMMTDMLEDPTKFPQTTGFRELKRWCPAYEFGAPTLDFKSPACDYQRDLYFWLNKLHPTHPVHDALAAKLISDCFRSGGPRGYCT